MLLLPLPFPLPVPLAVCPLLPISSPPRSSPSLAKDFPSTNSRMIPSSASFRRANSKTSSVMTVERPACRANASRSCAVFSTQRATTQFQCGRQEKEPGAPSCVQTISVKAPMNCGVAEAQWRCDSVSTSWPMENQREALRRWIVSLALW